METPESVTQHTPIRDADRLLSIRAVVVGPDDDLQHLAESAARQPAARVIAVTNEDTRLLGVIPVRVLVNEIFMKIVPEEFLGDITDMQDVLKYAKHVGARTAADIMLAPVSVALDDTVRTAFERMHRSRLNGLPIVDAAQRVVGYVDQLELLLVWVRASGLGTMLEPQDGEG